MQLRRQTEESKQNRRDIENGKLNECQTKRSIFDTTTGSTVKPMQESACTQKQIQDSIISDILAQPLRRKPCVADTTAAVGQLKSRGVLPL